MFDIREAVHCTLALMGFRASSSAVNADSLPCIAMPLIRVLLDVRYQGLVVHFDEIT
jgi:hypothetical protein